MRGALGLILAVLFLAPLGLAQQASSSDATKEDVEKLFTTLHLHEQMQSMMALSMEQSKQILHDNLKKKAPQISDEQLRRMDSFLDDFVKTMDLNGMLDDMIPVYQRHLTKQDVSTMLAFYQTPTDQKLLREQPAMMAEGMKATRPRMEKMMSDVIDQAAKMAQGDEQNSSGPESK